jgi:hypothetical protein
VAVLDGLVMLSHFNELREEGKSIATRSSKVAHTIASGSYDCARRQLWLRADGARYRCRRG